MKVGSDTFPSPKVLSKPGGFAPPKPCPWDFIFFDQRCFFSFSETSLWSKPGGYALGAQYQDRSITGANQTRRGCARPPILQTERSASGNKYFYMHIESEMCAGWRTEMLKQSHTPPFFVYLEYKYTTTSKRCRPESLGGFECSREHQ